MKTGRKNIYSYLIFLVFSATVIFLNLQHPPKQILTYDTFGYYLYLPGTFIYHQLEYSDQSTLEELNSKYHFTSTFYQLVRAPNMKYLDRYSMGLAFLYLPFFLLAHLIANLWSFPVDGLSPPYQYTLLAGGLIYSLIGIFILRKVLLKYLTDAQVALTLALLIFGTNYIYEAAFKGVMPHNLLFTAYAVLIWLTMKYHSRPGSRYAALTGLTAGLLILSRPSEVVCLLIPLLWGVTGRDSLKERWHYWKKNTRHLLIALACLLLVWIPQVIYWKAIAGQFLFYSYDNPGEGFDFLTPHTWHVLFSFRKGWLIYSPMMVFSLAGLYYLYRRDRGLYFPILLYFILNLYAVSSWTNWWYAESYGQRALIQSYAVMSIPLGFFVGHLFTEKKRWAPAVFMMIAAILITLNSFQIWQLRKGILHPSRMTGAYYFSAFGKTHVNPEQKKLLLVDRPATSREFFPGGEEYQGRDLALLDFEDAAGRPQDRIDGYDTAVAYSGRYSYRLDSNWAYSPNFDLKFNELTRKDHAWIRTSVKVYLTEDIKMDDVLLVVTFNHRGRYYKYRSLSLSESGTEVKTGQWNTISMDYITPEVRSKRDKISIYIWSLGKKPVFVDDMKIEVFEPM